MIRLWDENRECQLPLSAHREGPKCEIQDGVCENKKRRDGVVGTEVCQTDGMKSVRKDRKRQAGELM